MADIALSSAVSSLLTLEKQIGVTSNNIANANTTGYTKETVVVAERVAGGIGTGVADLGTVNNVDQYLQAATLQANTGSAQATAFNTIYQSLQQALGQITSGDTGGNDLASQLSTLQSSLAQLASSPENTSLRTQVVGELDDFTSNLRSLSSQIQQLRTSADSQISQVVSDANTQLNTIAGLNKQIQLASATGRSIASFSDQRANALQSLTADLGVNYYVDSSGAMQIYTAAGQPLLIGNTVMPLSHTSATITANSSYPGGGIAGIMVGNSDITNRLGGGKLEALVEQRDAVLPNAENSLDSLTESLCTSLNAIHNQGSTVPPPQMLSNSVNLNGADSVQIAANTTVRVAITDKSGAVQGYADVAFGAPFTSSAQSVANVWSAIDAAMNGGALPAGVSVTSAGTTAATVSVGSLQAGSNQGIAVSTLSGGFSATATAPSSDFSTYFHLNDLLTSNGASGSFSAATVAVRPDILANPNLLSTAQLTAVAAPAVGSPGVTSGDGSTASALSDALLNAQSFVANIATGIKPQSNLGNLGVAGMFTINGGSAPVTVTIASATSSLTDIAAAINAAAAAAGSTVQAAVVGTAGAYQLQMTSGGSQITFSSVSGNVLSSLGLSSSPLGYLGTTSATFAGFAAAFTSDVAARASNANSDQTSKQTTTTALQQRLSSQSGVNVDEETAQLATLQNLYAASAKVITTVNAMFQSLIQAVAA
jgi:flagellar hook-associated protein 1